MMVFIVIIIGAGAANATTTILLLLLGVMGAGLIGGHDGTSRTMR